MKLSYLVLATLLSLVLVTFTFGCAGASTTVTQTVTAIVTVSQSPITIPVTTYPVTAPPASGDVVVVIGGGYADPIAQVCAVKGFRWINEDHQSHTVTSDNEEIVYDVTLNPGESFVLNIDLLGLYPYHCTPEAKVSPP